MNEETKTVETNTPDTKPETQANDTPNYEEMYQQALIENAKLKRASDKATHEAADYKRQLREKQSVDEIAIQEKAEKEAEREERFKAMERELSINKLEKNFVLLGYSEEQANKAATAQVDGDVDILFKLQQEVMAAQIKTKEAEWIKSRPETNVGVGGETTTVTKEEFNKMGYSARRDFKEKYPETYKKYVN